MSKKPNRRGKRGPAPSQTIAQAPRTQPKAPNPQRPSFFPLVRPNVGRSDNPSDPVLQSLAGLIGTPITLTTKTAVRYRGIVATTAAQGNTTGVTLSDVKDLSAPGTPLKPSIFIASTNIESYVPEPLRINLTSNDSSRGNDGICQGSSDTTPEPKPQASSPNEGSSDGGTLGGSGKTLPPPQDPSPTIVPNEVPKVPVDGADNLAIVQSQSPPEKAPSHPFDSFADASSYFRNFVMKEKERLRRKRREFFVKDVGGLIEFSQNLKLNNPIPDDLIPILTRDKEKQRLIKEKNKRGAENHGTPCDGAARKLSKILKRSNTTKSQTFIRPILSLKKTKSQQLSTLRPGTIKIPIYTLSTPLFGGPKSKAQIIPPVTSAATNTSKSENRETHPETVFNHPFFDTAPITGDGFPYIKDDFKTNKIVELVQIEPQWPYQGAAAIPLTSEAQDLPTAASDLCRFMLLHILSDRDQRARICDLSGDDAQAVVDYLDIVSHEAKTLQADEQRRLLSLFCKLAKSAKLFPQCYALSGIEYNQEAVAGGSFAEVWKGKYGDKALCLKVVRVYRKQENDSILRTHVQELALWAHLSHRNILPFYGVYLLGTTTPRMCLVSPWMEKGNLRDYLDDFRQKPRLPFISDIINGLAYLHSLQIVHSDLKAQNVLVSGDERALITDFGMSSVAATTTLTSTGGTTRFMAPELVTGEGKVTETCDIWSFACLCYEVLTNKLPFYQYKNTQIFSVMVRKETPRLPEEAEGEGSKELGEQVWKLLVRCWDYEPDDRPNCEAIQEALNDIGFQDDRLEVTTKIETGSSFWQAMREKSSDKVDYGRVADILLPICSSRLFTQNQ